MAVRSSLKRLSQTFVEKRMTPGLYSDGNGLYLQITAGTANTEKSTSPKAGFSGTRSAPAKRSASAKMGLGAYPLVSPPWPGRWRSSCSLSGSGASTRSMNAKPISARTRDGRKDHHVREGGGIDIAAHRAGWRQRQHASQWPNTLKTYVYPILGEMAVRDIDTAFVMRCWSQSWTTKLKQHRGCESHRIPFSTGPRSTATAMVRSGTLERPSRPLAPPHGKVRKVNPQPALTARANAGLHGGIAHPGRHGA